CLEWLANERQPVLPDRLLSISTGPRHDLPTTLNLVNQDPADAPNNLDPRRYAEIFKHVDHHAHTVIETINSHRARILKLSAARIRRAGVVYGRGYQNRITAAQHAREIHEMRAVAGKQSTAASKPEVTDVADQSTSDQITELLITADPAPSMTNREPRSVVLTGRDHAQSVSNGSRERLFT